jgi:hypothetical protein
MLLCIHVSYMWMSMFVLYLRARVCVCVCTFCHPLCVLGEYPRIFLFMYACMHMTTLDDCGYVFLLCLCYVAKRERDGNSYTERGERRGTLNL